MSSEPPRVGDTIRDARQRSKTGCIEARVGAEPAAHYYVGWNDGTRTLIPASAIHRERLSITGYILLTPRR